MFKKILDKKEVYFFISIIFLFLILMIENIMFLNNQNSILFNILPNSSVADSHKFYYEAKNTNILLTIINFVKAYSINIKHYAYDKILPSNHYNHILYFSIFNNIFIFSFFNLFIYIFQLKKILNLINLKKKKIFYLISVFNFLLIGSLSLPNKEVIMFLSFNFFLLFYFYRFKNYLLLSIGFGLFSRYEYFVILVLAILYLYFKPLIMKIMQNINDTISILNISTFTTQIVKLNFLFFIFFLFLGLVNLYYPLNIFKILLSPNFELLYFKNYIIFIILFLIVYFFLIFGQKRNNETSFFLAFSISFFILILNIICPNYYWFYASVEDVVAFQNKNSLGITKFLIEISIDGWLFLALPVKFLLSFFSGIFQKINLSSYETIFTYISHLLFFLLFIFIVFKKTFLKNKELCILGCFFIVIFILPPIAVHRFVIPFYYLFVCLAFSVQTIKYK